MATAIKTRPDKKGKSVEITQRKESRFTFENYVINEFRELKSDIKSNFKWIIGIIISLLGILSVLITYFHGDTGKRIDRVENKLEAKIEKNTQAIHNIDKKLDRIIERLPGK